MAKKEKKVTNKENNNKDSKNKKSFFKGLKAELKKVIWPTPKQLVNNTIAVITIVLITTLIVFILDLAFESLTFLYKKCLSYAKIGHREQKNKEITV